MCEIVYYTNGKGGVAFSDDDGATVVVPSGRRIDMTPVWEECSDDLEGELNTLQVAKLDAIRSQPLTEIQAMARKMALLERKQAYMYPPKSVTYPKVGESALVIKADFD